MTYAFNPSTRETEAADLSEFKDSLIYSDFNDSRAIYIKRSCLKNKTKKGKRRHINSFQEKLFYIRFERNKVQSLKKMLRI